MVDQSLLLIPPDEIITKRGRGPGHRLPPNRRLAGFELAGAVRRSYQLSQIREARVSGTTLTRLANVLDLDMRELFLQTRPRARAILNLSRNNPVLSAREQCKNVHLLRRLHSVSEAEMGMLSRVASLGEVPSARQSL